MKKAWSFIKGLFSKIQRLKNKLIPIAVNVVEVIKKAIEKGTLDEIKDDLKILLPGWGDLALDELVAFLKKHIPEYAIELQIINATNLADKTEEAQKQALEALSETFGETWAEYMSGSSGKLAEYLSDKKIDWKEGKELGRDYYDTYIKNAA